MSRKKKHPEHVNHERWLVSYADFITLLFAFFVVLFASGQKDKRKQLQLAHSMQVAFDHDGIFDMHTRVPPITDDPSASQIAAPAPLALPLPTTRNDQAAATVEKNIRDVVRQEVERNKIRAGDLEIHSSPDGLVISLREAGFFPSGLPDVRGEALEAARSVVAALPNRPMRVEGHTDNIPIHTTRFATNWELSTARAATIARLVVAQHSVAPEFITAAGYAEFRPIADNATEQGRAKNRRVDIVLLAGSAASAATTPSRPAP